MNLLFMSMIHSFGEISLIRTGIPKDLRQGIFFKPKFGIIYTRHFLLFMLSSENSLSLRITSDTLALTEEEIHTVVYFGLTA